MTKKGKGGNSDGKLAAKRAKKAKQEKLADRKATKEQKREASLVAAKANAAKSGKGNKGKGKKAVVEDDDEDLDALLARLRDQWAEEHAVHEEKVGGPPSRRANATLTPCPLGTDLWLFGGEYFDGERVHFYPDLYRLTPGGVAQEAASSTADTKDPNAIGTAVPQHLQVQWRTYSSTNQPGPRSAHQVVATPANGGQLWLFGGEFSSAKGTSFHHYRDLWVFSITTKAWDRIDTKVRPSARSGHRMCMWRHLIVLFGGFQDTGARTTYLGDLWFFDTTEYKWTEIKQNDLRRPPARSGFSLLPTPEGIVLHGGYCKRYVKGQRTQGVALEDTWFLKLDMSDPTKILPVTDWQKRRKVGYVPSPARSGCTMALWASKAMGVLFGGVTDTENDEESLDSVCHNALYGYNLPGTGRWISLNLKRPKKMGGKGKRRKKNPAAEAEEKRRQIEERSKENYSSEEDEDERENIEIKSAEGAPHNGQLAESAPAFLPEEEQDPDDPERSIPLERYNAMLAVQRNTLYVYGGIHETPNREYTLDDFYTLDLSKLERFLCLKECPIDTLEWNESDDDSSSSSSGSDNSDTSDTEEEDVQEGEEFAGDEDVDSGDEEYMELKKEREKKAKEEREELRKKATAFMGVTRDTERSQEDVLSTPLPSETLRIFYDRTRVYWAQKAHSEGESNNRGKELRRDGFAIAERRYAEYKPILDEIERIQAEAGLEKDELKNSARTGGIGGAGPGADSRNRR